ncbi:hypothetical protein JTE90_011005 [Oedothorax gibbosus]|uniref:SRA1/Sec31 domain-containing protein n=1 Tax=Oedothorax gibbosus TaxID=931172 RepID=A0AAV6VDX9_9ARAC|nr:hypothetical protein JTE90_011005 [Oedothorax gibbosus]
MANDSPGPSWNDPPILKFDATASNIKPRLLNKRVYSSLNKTEHPSTVHKDSTAASPIPPTVLEKSPLQQNDSSANENIKSTDEYEDSSPIIGAEHFEFVSTTLRNTLNECPENSEWTVKQIESRLTMMEKSWDSELSNTVKHLMWKLSKELEQGNIDAALNIHCSLMVGHVREVKNWNVAVKKIIEIKSKIRAD